MFCTKSGHNIENTYLLERIKGVRELRPIHRRGFAPGSFCMCQYTRGSVFKFAQFAPGACSQIFNRLNIVEHFAGWKFCSRGWSIPMKSLVHTEELCSRSVPLEHAPGAKSRVCIGLYSHWEPSRASATCALGTRAFKFQRICESAEELVVYIFVSLV